MWLCNTYVCCFLFIRSRVETYDGNKQTRLLQYTKISRVFLLENELLVVVSIDEGELRYSSPVCSLVLCLIPTVATIVIVVFC